MQDIDGLEGEHMGALDRVYDECAPARQSWRSPATQ